MNKLVGSVTKGECMRDDGTKICPSSNRPKACTKEFFPVCGLFGDNECLNPPCTKTFGNRCLACSDSKVVTFTDGKCKEEDIFKV